jgi:hypothetical protein
MGKCYKGNEDPSGSTKGPSTVVHIYVIRHIIEKRNMQQEDISLIFYDLEKAYDSVPRELLWQASGKANVNQSLYKLLGIYIAIINAE